MIELANIFLNVCLPLLLVIGAGWVLDRRFDLDLKSLVKLNIYLFVPVYILVRLSTSTMPGSTGAVIIGFTLCIIGAMALTSWVVSTIRRDSRSERAGLQLGTMIYNSGNWGIPLMALAFPAEGEVAQVFVLATMNVSTFTVGVFLAHTSDAGQSAWKKSLGAVFRQPAVYAITTAIFLRISGNPLEEVVFVWKPLTLIADALLGVALLTLGIQLSKTAPPRPVGRMGWALVIRLIGGPLFAIGLTRLFGIDGVLAAILIVGTASPTAVNTALIAYEYGTDSRFAASVVFYSTLLASTVVTVLLAILSRGWIPWAG